MNAQTPKLALEAAHDISTPSRATGTTASRGVADWLALAAAPTFAIMALLTAVHGGGASDVLCVAARDASPLTGMVAMYLLMSAFHATPWLKLIRSRWDADRRP
jgi:hypothetical protein